MPIVTIDPAVEILRIFSCKRKAKGPRDQLDAVRDFKRRIDPTNYDSGISVWRLDKASVLEAVTEYAKRPEMDYGTAVTTAKELIGKGCSFIYTPGDHVGHVSLHCPRCDHNESGICAAPMLGCPFRPDTDLLDERTEIMLLFDNKDKIRPAVPRDQLVEQLRQEELARSTKH